MSRFEVLVGKTALSILQKSTVAVFGLGGVGSYAAEALARSGIGGFCLVDGDVVEPSNINRQVIALESAVGLSKAEVMHRRIADINPNAKIVSRCVYFSKDTSDSFDFSSFDYVIDAIDSVPSKVLLVKCSQNAKTPIISAMGAGNRLDPTCFGVADIYSTNTCPLARIMRHELRKNGISSLKTVYSKEKPKCFHDKEKSHGVPLIVGSASFVTPVAGLILASEVIKDIIKSG